MSIESAFTQFPTLSTPRLLLRQIRAMDAQSIFELFSDQNVMEFDSDPLYTSLRNAETYIERIQKGYIQRRDLRWGITLPENDTIIGTCGFHHFSEGYHCLEIGYDLHRAYWGKGIMSEAMSAVLAFGFTDLACHRIEAVIDHANVRSRALVLKLGFTYEGTLRQRYPVGDHFEDESYYGLLKPEWLAKQPETR